MCKEKGCNINNAPKIRNYKMPKFQTIYGYMFDCHRFLYNNRIIMGLCCAIKVPNTITEEKIHTFVSIQLSVQDGFTVCNNSNDFDVELYKIYVLALCKNLEEEAIEITDNVLTQYAKYIIKSESICAESRWFINIR